MTTLECGCVLTNHWHEDNSISARIVMCPTHANAEKMRDALQTIVTTGYVPWGCVRSLLTSIEKQLTT